MAPAEIIAPIDDPLSRTEATPDETTWRRSRKRRFDERDETAGTENATEDSPESKTSYHCRFCLMNFEKSQALGGHMNRHRNERIKEQLDNARQLVSNVHQQQRTWSLLAAEIQSNAPAPGAPSHLSYPLTGAATGTYGPPISFPNHHPGPATGPYYMPSNPSSNNMQNAQWHLDGSLRPGNFAVDDTATGVEPQDSELVSRVVQYTMPSNPSSNNVQNAQWHLDGSLRPDNVAVDDTATGVGLQGSELVSRVVQDTTTAANDNSGNPNQMSHDLPQYIRRNVECHFQRTLD